MRKIHLGKHDGLVILGKTEGSKLPLITAFRKQVVYITLNQMGLEEDQVMCDGQQATEKALKYLYENGYRSIAYIGEGKNEIRYVSYRSFLIKMRLDCPREHIISTSMTTEGGYSAAKRLLECKDLPTSVFCANDVTALGVLKGLRDSGVMVPKDISIISIDNIAEAELSNPPLTTVKIPLRDMGSMAVKTLVDRINNGHRVYMNIFMPSKLVIRESVKKI